MIMWVKEETFLTRNFNALQDQEIRYIRAIYNTKGFPLKTGVRFI